MVLSRRWGLTAVGGVAVLAAAMFFVYRSQSVAPSPQQTNPQPGFRERALDAGLTFRMNFLPNEQGAEFKINLYDHGSGVAVGDFDGDGRDDIYLLNQLGPNALYHNNGDGTFTDVAEQAGVALGDRVCVAATWADYDNSGRQSLYVTSTRGGNVLFKNLGHGQFRDVTKEAGLTLVAHCTAAVFFDYDNDGYLDLLVTSTAGWTSNTFDQVYRHYPGVPSLVDLGHSPKEYNHLYHNNRDGTFTDVTAKAGLQGKGWVGDVAVLDYDEDGYLDVLISNMFGRSQLYHNNRDGTFTDVTEKTLGRTSWGGSGCKAFDFNNDGKLDLYIVDMHSDMWVPPRALPRWIDEIKKHQHEKYPALMGASLRYDPECAKDERTLADAFGVRYDQVVFGNTFFKNLGGGKFKEVSDKAGLETFWPWGIAVGDFDNDGFQDVFLPSGMGYPFFYWPNALLMNNGNETFTDRALAAGIEPPARGQYQDQPIGGEKAARSSRCAAVADFDGDGRLDLIVNNFNDTPYYFQNQFPRRNYIAFRLHGTHSNRDAIGALVRLYTGREVMVRQVDPAGGYFAQSSKTVHFGLGERTRIDRVEITWPRGWRQVLESPVLNQVNDVEEPSEAGPASSAPH